MIIGPCPYSDCDELHMVPIGPRPPMMSRERCEGCGRTYWLRHSRIEPDALTEEEFATGFDVDHATKMITPKEAP